MNHFTTSVEREQHQKARAVIVGLDNHSQAIIIALLNLNKKI